MIYSVLITVNLLHNDDIKMIITVISLPSICLTRMFDQHWWRGFGEKEFHVRVLIIALNYDS